MTESPTIHLADLVRPLGYERFVTEHWLAETPFLSEPNPELVANLRAIAAFESPQALVERLTNEIGLLGPRLFRGRVAPAQALNFLNQGYTLYVFHIEQQIPEVRDLTRQIAGELGAANLGVGVEAFVGLPGAISTVHYDHDINFQVLLEGEKRWHVAPNRHIRNPLQPYHPARGPDGSIHGFVEEAYARDPVIGPELPAGARVFEARAGTTMFVPRAWWHEVESLTACFGINFVIRGSTWATALTQAVADLLHGDEDGRELCYGTLAGSEGIRAHTERRFEAIRRRAIATLQELTIEEVYLGGRNATFAWTDPAAERSLIQTDGQWTLVAQGLTDEPLPLDDVLLAVMRKLVPLRHPFKWEHLAVLAKDEIRGAVGAVGLWNLLADLVEAGYLRRVASS